VKKEIKIFIGIIILIIGLTTIAIFESQVKWTKEGFAKGWTRGYDARTSEELLQEPGMIRLSCGFMNSYVFYDCTSNYSFTIQSDLYPAEILTIIRYIYRQDRKIIILDKIKLFNINENERKNTAPVILENNKIPITTKIKKSI
jgi:hypothetical protein